MRFFFKQVVIFLFRYSLATSWIAKLFNRFFIWKSIRPCGVFDVSAHRPLECSCPWSARCIPRRNWRILPFVSIVAGADAPTAPHSLRPHARSRARRRLSRPNRLRYARIFRWRNRTAIWGWPLCRLWSDCSCTNRSANTPLTVWTALCRGIRCLRFQGRKALRRWYFSICRSFLWLSLFVIMSVA